MLVERTVVAALALTLCSQHAAVVAPASVPPLNISVGGNEAPRPVPAQTEAAVDLPGGGQVTGDPQESGVDGEREVAAGAEGKREVQPQRTLPPGSSSSTGRWSAPGTADAHSDTTELGDSGPSHDGPLFISSAAAAASDAAGTLGSAPSRTVGDPVWTGVPPPDADLGEVQVADRRLLPLILMGDPEPPEPVLECSHSIAQPAGPRTFVDAFDDDGCESCELDDEGLPITGDDAAGSFSQFVPAGLDPQAAAERLQELFQAGLLDKDTFSAEDRRRWSLRISSQANTDCTCSVGDQETICSKGGNAEHFCDQLPYTTVPSGILEVSHTNISVLGVGSLEFVNVSVLRLTWNEVELVEPGVFSNMSLLTNLSLAHNRLQAMEVQTLSGAAELREIVLAYNRFTELTMATQALGIQVTPKLAHLNIGGNNFSAIGPEDFAPMRGVPLEDVQLHENNIGHIDPRTFSGLTHLRRLRLRDNPLPLDEVVELIKEMNNTSLELVDLSMIGEYTIGQLRPVLNAVAGSSIISLMLNNYCFASLYGINFPAFPRLKELSMRSCGIRYIYPSTFNDFPVLESLDLRDNSLTYVPTAVILPYIVSLDLSRPALRRYTGDLKPSFSVSQYRFRNMVNLRYLDLSYNNITKLERGAFVGLENLTALLLKDTELEHIANFSFSMLENLSELHLSDNYLSSQPFEHLWQGLTGLTVLLLDNCLINSSQLYLSEMPRMELLNLTGNSLGSLTPATFHGLSFLNTVDLSENNIQAWNERVFGDAWVLESLYLRYNNITWISTAMAEDFLNPSLRVLMLGFNPFHCSCHLHDWLHGLNDSSSETEAVSADWGPFRETNGGYVTSDMGDCFCHSPESLSNKSVLEFFELSPPQSCPTVSADRTSILIAMLPLFAFALVATVVVRLVCKKRWYLRYWLFKIKSKHWLKRLKKDGGDYLYDAFVSYSSEDAGFVSEMIEKLEKTQPFYRLCVYERDFEIGNFISECILESINTSRKSILILTDNFAKSHWCRWEVNLVQCRLFEQTRNDLILVKLGKVRSRHLTPVIRYLMRTRVYIEWGPSAQQQLLFWERLRAALRKPGGAPQLPRTV